MTFLFTGSPVDASGESERYVFECDNGDNQLYFEAMGHTFLVPGGFHVDAYNENSLVLTVVGSSVAGSRIEVQAIIIRYGVVDDRFHEDWKSISSQNQREFDFDVKTHTEDHAYGARSYWLALVGSDEQILISSLVPVDWQSFLKCKIT